MEPDVYVVPVNDPYEQPTDSVYDIVMPCTPQVQPAPPPCSAQVPAGPPKGPFRWSLRKKILVPVGAVSISALIIVAGVLSWYFVTKTPSTNPCQMYCSYTYTCIHAYQICDGVQDCPYGDDEKNCVTKTPSTNPCQMYCSYTYTCIHAYQICDGVQDCPYGDDEKNCATTTPSPCQMYCSYTYTCIHAYQICNGVQDCAYGDDERNCATTTPSPCQMYCSYTYTCIHAYQICNGVQDCAYGDDERNCVTTPFCEKRCGSSVSCVLSSQWCDGVSQCPNGEDETSCVRLYGADSQLQVYSTLKSAWLPVCADNWNDTYGRFACQDFGFNGSSYNRYNTLMSPFSPVGYFKLYNGNWTSRFYTSVQNSSFCLSGNVVSLHCISCGVSNNSVTSRIVGGTYANLGNWPWQVNLQYMARVLCGGSIISPRWIVTAAHCVYGSYSSAPGWKVFAGTLTLPSYYDPSGYSVERIIAHPGYYSSTNDNDIALMELTNELTFGYSIQPVCLPNSGMFWEAGTASWISGWGSTYEGGSASTYLRYAEVPLIDSNVCNKTYAYNGQITASMICAGYLSGGVDTCQGDSGGPLVTQTNATWWLVGDTSWGYGCARAYKPGVYGNMTTFLDWIYLQMRTYS